MREITEHRVNPANDRLTIMVTDEPGAGGACHRYEIRGFDAQTNPAVEDNDIEDGLTIIFQNGPIGEVGVNGVTQEVLLAIVADRLRSFQSGPYACPENADALDRVMGAQSALDRRTIARLARGVEGTHEV